ncbi:hypothetical protein H9T43_002179 [Salmonella enterica]|nr:hypothetical protein [Salmonella enterica]
MSKKTLSDYYAALERLIKRKAKINNDTVALEAGRKKGTIKKSRPIYTLLIKDIENAAFEQSQINNNYQHKLTQYKNAAIELRKQLDGAYAREVSLLAELLETKRKLHALTGESILPLRRKTIKE